MYPPKVTLSLSFFLFCSFHPVFFPPKYGQKDGSVVKNYLPSRGPRLIPCTHRVACNICTSRGFDALFWPPQALYRHGAQTQTSKTSQTYTKIKVEKRLPCSSFRAFLQIPKVSTLIFFLFSFLEKVNHFIYFYFVCMGVCMHACVPARWRSGDRLLWGFSDVFCFCLGQVPHWLGTSPASLGQLTRELQGPACSPSHHRITSPQLFWFHFWETGPPSEARLVQS